MDECGYNHGHGDRRTHGDRTPFCEGHDGADDPALLLDGSQHITVVVWGGVTNLDRHTCVTCSVLRYLKHSRGNDSDVF